MATVLTAEETSRIIIKGGMFEALEIWLWLLGFSGDREECGFIVTELDDGRLQFFASKLVDEYGDEEDCMYHLEPDEWRRLAPGESIPEENVAESQ